MSCAAAGAPVHWNAKSAPTPELTLLTSLTLSSSVLTSRKLITDFAFQCTGAPAAAHDIYEYIRRGGGMCEMGFFVNNGEYSVNPHFAMCNKEINIVGSWDYSADDYPTTMAFLRQAREMNIPIKELITHTFPLDKLNEAMEVNVAQEGIKICYVAD